MLYVKFDNFRIELHLTFDIINITFSRLTTKSVNELYNTWNKAL
jgi:hypothetical protein